MGSITDRIMELIERNSEARDNLRQDTLGPYFYSVEHQLHRIRKELVENPVSELSAAGLRGDEGSIKAARALSYVPVPILLDQFAVEMAIAVWDNLIFNREFKMYGQRIAEATELHLGHLILARRAQIHRTGQQKDAAGILRSYDLVHGIASGELLAMLDIAHHLQLTRAIEQPLKDARVRKYSYKSLVTDGEFRWDGGQVPDWKSRCVGNREFNIWIDAPVAVGLFYEDKPQALVGLSSYTDGTLMIYQVQGVGSRQIGSNGKYIRDQDGKVKKGGARGLAVLDWRKLLVEHVAMEVAQALGYKQLGLQGGENNYWIKPYRNQGIHLSVEEARKKYDGEAERFGFIKAEDNNWYRNVNRTEAPKMVVNG